MLCTVAVVSFRAWCWFLCRFKACVTLTVVKWRSECILVREPKEILSKCLVYTVTQWALFKHSRILSMVPQATMASC